MYVAETKALISCMVTVQLICAFVFAFAKNIFSHDAHFVVVSYKNVCNVHVKTELVWFAYKSQS